MSSPRPTRPTGKRGRGLGQHLAARGFRHGGADRRVDDAGRDAVHAHRRKLERESCASATSSAPLAAPTIAEFGRGRMLRKPETKVSEPPERISAARAQRQAPQNLPSMVARTSSIETVLNGPVLQLRGGDHDVIDRRRTAGTDWRRCRRW